MLELAKLAQVVSSPSRLQMIDELMRGPRSAVELAAKLSLSTVTIRHHLRWLERAAVVEEVPAQRSGQPGRPTNRFRLCAEPLQIKLPPRDFQGLAEVLAATLLSSLGPAGVRKVARKVGTALGAQVGAALLAQSQRGQWSVADFRRHLVEGHCAQRGFAPEVIEERSGAVHFRLHNCIVLEVARKHPEFVCALDLPMMRSLARTTLGESNVQQLGCMGHGDPCCEYLVVAGREASARRARPAGRPTSTPRPPRRRRALP